MQHAFQMFSDFLSKILQPYSTKQEYKCRCIHLRQNYSVAMLMTHKTNQECRTIFGLCMSAL